MVNEILLVRDSSKLSSEVEKYLEENYSNYNIFYQSQKDSDAELPWIFAPPSFLPYHGKAGFNWFKMSHLEKKNIAVKV